MKVVVNLRKNLDWFMEDIMFYNKPNLTFLFINFCVFGALGTWFTLTFMPLRILSVIGLHAIVLSNSEFWCMIAQSFFLTLSKTDWDHKKADFLRVVGRLMEVMHTCSDVFMDLCDRVIAFYRLISMFCCCSKCKRRSRKPEDIESDA